MQIIKKVRPANVVGKDDLLHILGGAVNVNSVSGCICKGSPDDTNLNASYGCECK